MKFLVADPPAVAHNAIVVVLANGAVNRTLPDWKEAGVKSLQDRRPDIIAVRWDGKVEAFEVQSATDQVVDLEVRLRQSMLTLPAANQTPITTANIIRRP